jgi:hypothetical protein
MALRIKSKWHRSRRSRKNMEGSQEPKTLTDLSSVIAFNLWKVAKELYRNMENEDFRFDNQQQVMAITIEVMAFLVQVVDRTVYGKVEEEERGPFINALAQHLGRTLQETMTEMMGEGDYMSAFYQTLNERFAEYAECPWDVQEGPGYAFRRTLGEKIADHMASVDNRWVVEQVMDIEAPKAAESLMRLTTDVLGLRAKSTS